MLNTTLYDLAVRHFADVRLYEEGMQTANGRILRRHEAKLRDLVKRGKPDLQQEVSRFITETHTSVNGRLSDLDAASQAFHVGALHRVTGSFFQVSRPEFQEFDPAIGLFKTSLRSELKAIGENHLRAIEAVIRDNPGLSKTELAKLAASRVPIAGNKVATLTRTLATQVENSAAMRVMEANRDVVKGYRFTAVLDGRTSEVCRAHNGEVYALNDVKYRPPLHWNCRSYLVPVLRKKADIKGPRVIGPVPDTGEVKGREDYNEWLRRQPADVQIKHLGGEEQMSLFQRGKLAVSEFFTPKGKSVSIEELRKLDNKRVDPITPDLPQLPAFRRPSQLINSPREQELLERMYVDDAQSANQMLALTDYRGTTILGKRTSRVASMQPDNERVMQVNPWTGEAKNTLLYDPDFTVLQEKLDNLANNRALQPEQREFIKQFVERMEDRVSVNQQSVILDNLRVSFERFNRDGREWESVSNVLRAEMKYSVQNVSAVLDTRSRKNSETFGLTESVVRIGNRQFTFEELVKSYYDDARYVREWKSEILAAKLLARGKAPLSAIISVPPVPLPKLPKLKDITGQRVANYITGTPQRSILGQAWDDLTEPIKRIINLDFSLWAEARKQLPKAPSQVSVMSGILKEVAAGHSSDYDTLAIKLGERMYDKWKPHEFYKPTMQERHKAGSAILEQMRKDGLISVSKRGVTRRAVIDVDTGRPNGEWKDTISREVIVIDPELKEIQLRERKVMLAQRMGLVKLHARPGEKVLYDELGRKSGVSVITRNASIDYDPKLLDDDFIKMLNHTMSTQYTVDYEFGTFMDELARFRDDRGRVKEFDDLNKWRQLIIQRGDQGYGFLQTVRYHTHSGVPFSVPAQIDGRGRVYYVGYLSPTGGEVARPFLNSAKSYAFGKSELRELMLQTGALIGPATDALTQAGRLEIFAKHEADILSLGRLLMAKTQRQQKMRDYLSHPLILEMDAEEVPKITRLALEYARVYDHTGGNLNLLTGYSEGSGSTYTHMGVTRSVDSLLALAARSTPKQVSVNKLSWVLDHTTIDPARVAAADYTVPVVVTRMADGELVVLDGAHRLAAAMRDGKTTIPMRLVDEHMLDAKIPSIKPYRTQLMIENDASSSGAQIIGLSTGDRDISINSNVLATSKKNRLYDLVAMDTAADPRLREIPAFRHVEITWEDLQKAAKSANMVAFYGAGDATQAANIEAKFASVLGKKGLTVITKDEMRSMKRSVDKAIKDAEYAGAEDAYRDLVQLRKELMSSLNDEAPLGRQAAKAAREVSPDVALVVDKLQSNRVVRPKDFDAVAALMSEHLGERAPVTKKFTKFWNEAAKLYIQDTNSTDIPWVTFDGKTLVQRYRVTEQSSIEWYDPVTKRMVRNIYEERAKDGVLRGKSSIANARIGTGVNGNHMNDATIVRQFHLWGAKNDVPTATIHDAFFTSISHVDSSKAALREIYADASESDTIRNTLRAMRKNGMSESSYRELLARAIEDGLVDPPNKITRSDVLAPIPSGKDWYGIGP